MAESNMSVEQEVSVEQQEKRPTVRFDEKVKALFRGTVERNTRLPIATPLELEGVDNFLAATDRFTDKWWEGLYEWMDQRDFHNEKYSVAQITFESLETLPPDAKLPHMFSYWASNALHHDAQLKEQIMAALENDRISASLRAQIPAQLARHPDIWSLDTILKGYRLFGEPVGQEMRKNIVPLFMSGLAIEEVFNSNRDSLTQLYADAGDDTPKKPSVLSKISHQFNKFRGGHRVITAERKTDPAGRRVEIIRDLVRKLFPTYQEYYDTKGEGVINLDRPLKDIPPLTEDESNAIERLSSYSSEISNQYNNEWGVGRDLSIFPLDILERYLSDVRQLKILPGFETLATRIMGDGNERGILSPYTALGANTRWIFGEQIPLTSIFNLLYKLDKSEGLDDRIADEFCLGIDKNLFSDEQKKQVARRNLRILIKHQLSEEVYGFRLSPLLTIPEENVLNDGLETVMSIQVRDKTTSVLLLESLPKLFAFGDKYKIVLDYVKRERKREDLRRIGAFKHVDKVSKALNTIQLTDSGKRQGERLVKLAITLDAVWELNEVLQLGISDVVIVPDLKTSYENAQTTLRGICQQLGIANLDEVYKFLPWIKTKDETALKILRGEEVAKVGEPRSYNLQASSKPDLEGMRKDIESYAKAIGIELPEVSAEDLNLESLKQMAAYVIAELSKRKDISEEVLEEVKPNLDRIITSMGKGGSYTFSINPQDIKSQLEALQNVGSCLSPGGSMFRYTKEYLRNPNTSWAIIKGAQGVVGRVTMFRGTDESGRPAIARVSKVYAQVAFDESEVDNTLRNFANDTNVTFVERGKLTVPGLQDFYDDFIGTGRGPAVVINR